MHRCLLVTEIFTNICEAATICMDDDGSKPACSQPTLFAVAQVSKAFLGPTLDELWRLQSSLVRVLKTLPSDAWKEIMGDNSKLVFTFCRPILPSEWDRLSYYTKRMRKLALPEIGDLGIDPNVYRMMEVSRQPFFQNLHRLHFRLSDNSPLHSIPPFIGPYLKHVCLEFDDLDPADHIYAMALITSLSACALSLTHLEIASSNAISLPPFACQALNNIHTLKLHETSVTEECFVYLSKAPFLHILCAYVRDFQPKIASGSACNELFCSLQDLHIIVDSFKTATNFIRYYFHSAKIFKIRIASDEIPSRQDFNQLIIAIRSKLSLVSLTDLTLIQSWDEPVKPPECVLEPCDLEPLFGFLNLEILVITEVALFHKVDNMLVREIANAWPRLQQLELTARSQTHSSVTVEGLRALASCTYLKSLWITLDPAVPDINSLNGQTKNPSTSPLADLEVGFSLIVDPLAIASFLSAIFPNLENIHAGSQNEADDSEPVRLWRQVQGFYQHFIAVRRQERLWAAEN